MPCVERERERERENEEGREREKRRRAAEEKSWSNGAEGVHRDDGPRALFSDNVSRIETALKQPINAVTRPSHGPRSIGLGGPISSDFGKLLLRPRTTSGIARGINKHEGGRPSRFAVAISSSHRRVFGLPARILRCFFSVDMT